jgi:ferredoxin
MTGEVLRVNPIRCEAHGLCAELFPEWIRLDDWGYPIVDPRPVPPALREHARRAVSACPTLALMLRRVETLRGAGREPVAGQPRPPAA